MKSIKTYCTQLEESYRRPVGEIQDRDVFTCLDAQRVYLKLEGGCIGIYRAWKQDNGQKESIHVLIYSDEEMKKDSRFKECNVIPTASVDFKLSITLP